MYLTRPNECMALKNDALDDTNPETLGFDNIKFEMSKTLALGFATEAKDDISLSLETKDGIRQATPPPFPQGCSRTLHLVQ